MMMEDVADFEEMAKKSWQSFSTMKRFVSEASRLENASWRLWFMQRSAMRQPEHHAHEASEHEYVPCVYCEMHAASLSCHGCCHDAYCVSCFKLVHKKGHLATHTAVKIQELTARERERLAAHVHGDVEMASDEESGPKAPPESTLPTVVAVSPEQSRHPPTRDRATRKAKSWEVQMDILLQRLMLNSIHSDNDISVHNIDSRHSLGTAESLASMLSDTTSSEDPTAALQSLLHDGSDDGIEVEGGRVPVPDCEWKERGSGGSHSNTDAATAKAMEREQPHADGKTEERATRKLLSVDVSAQDSEQLPSSPTATMTPSSSASSMGVVSPAIGPLNASDESLESLDGLSMSLFSTPTMAKSKSRKKNSVCANCSGNHITIDCPLLENSLGGNVGLPSASGGLHTGGVDTVLRKCFTTIHNDNLSNSTHAFLGDEISVRGGGNFSKAQFGSTTKTSALWSTFGMNSIAEDQAADVEDSLPVLVGLVADGEPRRWDCGTWMVSCLATELPLDVFQTLRRADKMASSDPLGENGLPSTFGWVHVKKPGSKWCKRFMCLHRNSLWEYLDDKETSRPIAYANLADGTVHAHQNTTVEFAFRFFRYSTPDSPRDECWMQCESEQDTTRWRDALTRASKLQAEDIFDMRPDSPTSSPHEDPYELGKGRFASVRRARRRKGVSSSQKVEDCALKIIDKRVFWDLVAHETERDDTVIREILTQALLTIRAGSGYCPVIRLLSLFETRSHLIMELELMREGDLHEEIVTKSAVSEARASFLVSSLVQAIKFCLENGVAHRDVKLSNLALDTSASSKGRTLSVIKLADFGMAAFVQEDGMLRGRCGTPGFVAPEILTAGKGEAYPAGVDMFSVGVVTYTMLCGYEPFFGVNDEELIQMNKAVDYEFEEPEWSSISDEAKDLITLMMERDPTRRITPAEALHHPFLIDATRALREVATGVDLQPSAPFVRLL